MNELITLRFKRLAQVIGRWYNGTEVPYRDYGSVTFITPIMKYHWTARLTRVAVKFFTENWFACLTLVISLLTLIVTIAK